MALLLDPGDTLLVEEYAFGTAISVCTTWDAQIQPIKMDKDGLLPEDLEQILENWDDAKGRRPRVL